MVSQCAVLWTLIVALGASLVCQCSGEERFKLETIDPGRPNSAYRAACASAATNKCKYDARCNPTEFPLVWYNFEECVERTALNCELRAAEPAYGLNAEAIAACIRSEQECASAEKVLPAHCDFQWAGKLEIGKLCFDHATCKSGYCMPPPSHAGLNLQCGTCQQYECLESCPDGQFCHRDVELRKSYCRGEDPEGTACTGFCGWETFCVEGVCRRGRKEGEACELGSNSIAPCLDDFRMFCHPTRKVCTPRAREDEACDDAGMKAAPCTYGTFCDKARRCKLVKRVWYDEPCGVVDDGVVDCWGRAVCSATRVRPEGACIRPAGDGMICDPNQRLNCMPPAVCIEGFCRFPKLEYCKPF